MQKYWNRWGWLTCLLILALFCLRMAWGREPFCGAEDEQCSREWISALAGWFAIPSLFYLAKQVRDAERFNRAAMQLQILPIMHAAKHAWNLSATIKSNFEEELSAIKQLDFDDGAGCMQRILTLVDRAIADLSRDEFRGASAQFGTYHNADATVAALAEAKEVLVKFKFTHSQQVRFAGVEYLEATFRIPLSFLTTVMEASNQRMKLAEAIIAMK